MDKKEVTLQEKARNISGFKYYVEMSRALIRSTYDRIFNDIYLLSIIGEDDHWSHLFLPKGTHIICKKIPENFKPDGFIDEDPASFLELGKTYTIAKSVVGSWYSWYELDGLPSKCRVSLSWFEIAAEDRPTPQKALKLYSGNIDEEYEFVMKYMEWENKRLIEEEEKKPKELFIYNGLRFDYFELDNYAEDFKGEDFVHICLCKKCAKKYLLPDSLIYMDLYNGEPFLSDCSGENCYEKAVYGYAVPLKDGKIIYEQKKRFQCIILLKVRPYRTTAGQSLLPG